MGALARAPETDVCGCLEWVQDAGFECVLANPKGGATPIDASSLAEPFVTEETKRYDADEETKKVAPDCFPQTCERVDGFRGVCTGAGELRAAVEG